MPKPLLLLRISVTAGLLFWLLARQDLSSVSELFWNMSLTYWLLAVAITWLGIVTSAARLLVILRVVSVRVNLTTLSRICLGGVFIGNFLPSTVGGDALKFAYLRNLAARRLDVVVALLADRGTGLAAILIAATVGALSYRGVFVSDGLVWGVLAIDFLFAFGMAAAIGWQPSASPSLTPSRSLSSRLVAWLRDSHATLHAIGRNYRASLSALALSMLFVGQVIAISYVFAMGLGLSVTLGELATTTVLVQLATMAPISFNGVGVREWGYVLILGWLDVSSEAALSLSLMIYLTVVVASLPGALLLTEEPQPKNRHPSDEDFS